MKRTTLNAQERFARWRDGLKDFDEWNNISLETLIEYLDGDSQPELDVVTDYTQLKYIAKKHKVEIRDMLDMFDCADVTAFVREEFDLDEVYDVSDVRAYLRTHIDEILDA